MQQVENLPLVKMTLREIERTEAYIGDIHSSIVRVLKTGDKEKRRFMMYRDANAAHRRVAMLVKKIDSALKFYEQYA